MNFKIGDRVFVRGYIDEIRKDTVIIRNNGGYFGTIPSEVTGELPSVQPESSEYEELDFVKEHERIPVTLTVQPEEVARDIATIIENEKDMRVILANGQTGWIPVTERLPEKRGKYIVCLDGYVFSAVYHPDGVYDGNIVWSDYHWTGMETGIIQQIEAWMPFPEPWRGQE